MKIAHRQFLAYALVGVVGTAVQYLALVAGVSAAGWSPVIASSIGAVLGALTNYLLNYRLTFRARTSHPEAFLKFASVALTCLLINGAVVDLAIRFFDAHYLLAQVIATVAVLLFGFAANRNWTFKEDSNERASA